MAVREPGNFYNIHACGCGLNGRTLALSGRGIPRGDKMIRTPILAALTLALTSASALAQADAPNAPPAQLSNPDNGPYAAPNNGPPPPPNSQQTAQNPQGQNPQDRRSRDIFCRR